MDLQLNKRFALFEHFMKKMSEISSQTGMDNSRWKAFFSMVDDGLLDNQSDFCWLVKVTYPLEVPNQQDFRTRILPNLNPEYTSDERGLEARDKAPDFITIYRGASEMEITRGPVGPSWSLNRGVAEWFAFRFPEDYEEKMVVYSATVNKSLVRAWFYDFCEKEVLLLVEPQDTKIIADEPTEAFDNYLQLKEKYDAYRNGEEVEDEDSLFT